MKHPKKPQLTVTLTPEASLRIHYLSDASGVSGRELVMWAIAELYHAYQNGEWRAHPGLLQDDRDSHTRRVARNMKIPRKSTRIWTLEDQQKYK